MVDEDQPFSIQEINLLIQLLQTVGDFPQVDYGSPVNRAERMRNWKHAMQMLLSGTRPVVVRYWNKIVHIADDHYNRWVIAPIMEKSLITCEPQIPAKYEEIEMWLRPRILEVIPTKLNETILQEQQLGMTIPVAGMLFKLNVLMQPGNLDEHDTLLKTLTSPIHADNLRQHCENSENGLVLCNVPSLSR